MPSRDNGSNPDASPGASASAAAAVGGGAAAAAAAVSGGGGGGSGLGEKYMKDRAHLSPDLKLKQNLKKLGSLTKGVNPEALELIRSIAEEEEAERRREKKLGQKIGRRPELQAMFRQALTALEKADVRRGQGGAFVLRVCSGHDTRRIAPVSGPVPSNPSCLVIACANGVGAVRKRALLIVETPAFDQFIMVCILANCVLLAAADPTTDEESQFFVFAGLVFLVIFTVEALTKAIALGHLYGRDFWNWLDVVVVVSFTHLSTCLAPMTLFFWVPLEVYLTKHCLPFDLRARAGLACSLRAVDTWPASRRSGFCGPCASRTACPLSSA